MALQFTSHYLTSYSNSTWTLLVAQVSAKESINHVVFRVGANAATIQMRICDDAGTPAEVVELIPGELVAPNTVYVYKLPINLMVDQGIQVHITAADVQVYAPGLGEV